jgi:hypothetical protein
MLKPIALALATLAAFPAHATTGFEAVRERAVALESLAGFLERYVGSCRDALTRADCERNVREARRALARRTYTARVAEQTLDLVKVERTGSGWRFLVTPFVDGGGLGLSHGQPRRQDAQGRALVPYIVLESASAGGLDEMAVESALRTGRIELEIVFAPERTWSLKRRNEPGLLEGVSARFLALRLVETRSGAEIASKVL